MKKTLLLCSLSVIAGIAAGFAVGQTTALKQSVELIEVQHQTIIQAEKLMDKNNLWDADGSDDMCDYMNLYDEANNLYYGL